MRRVLLSEELGLLFEFGEWSVPINPVWPSMAIGLLGTVVMTGLYLYAEMLEERGLIRRVD